ncbi:hypothetical protein [Helicobacter pylori]|uniref:hypothetical protein n=1 Tax=Helicobacter pylori TaxID=210 RepID=UPI000FDECB5F|nr:hypothetical protein [Helicobacter pylori]RVY22421.1 hypothetical protein ECC09_08075 [Helicobacter pylori]
MNNADLFWDRFEAIAWVVNENSACVDHIDPMTATISIGATKTNNKEKNRLYLFLDLLDKHGEILCSGFWNLENKEQSTMQEQLESAIISFIKEADPNKD